MYFSTAIGKGLVEKIIMKKQAEIVICGAGIGGITTAYMLAVRHGIKDIVLVDERAPLSLTSDKSTECYRNWWPGPGDAMVQMTNRSIDIFEELSHESGNLFHLNRRGYLYATTNPDKIADLEGFAEEASSLGAGDIRRYTSSSSKTYQPAEPEGFEDVIGGADLITDKTLIQENFPYLSEDIAGALHVRKAGWLSAQQYGMYLLDQARDHGVELVEGRVEDVEVSGGKVSGVGLSDGHEINTSIFVNAAGPLLAEVGEMLEVEILVFNELHMKAAFNDNQRIVGRDAPLLIYVDEQKLDWTEGERSYLAEDENTRWLTETLPSGAHVRPEGAAQAESIILLWDTHNQPVEVVIPPALDPMYAEIALRGLCKFIPGLQAYVERMPKPYVDGGYYTKTQENRPLACPLSVEGAYVIGAMSGFGIMASPALGELVAAHITNTNLPEYALAFDLARYENPEYQKNLETWGDSWQLGTIGSLGMKIMTENSASSKSLSPRLHESLLAIIDATPPGDRLLTEPKLAKQLGVSRATLREAMRTFETQGLIYRKQGVGTFVIHPSRVIKTGLEALESILTLADRIDLEVIIGDYKIVRRPGSENEIEIMGLEAGANIIQVSWVIEAESRPVAYLVDILPEDVLSKKEIQQNFTGSVLDLLHEKGEIPLSTSRTEINAVAASPDIARALGVQRGDVLLYFEATLYSTQGRVVDYSYSYYLPGYFKFHVVRRVG